MTKNVKKTTPSEGIKLAWLAGIIDGEGSIGIYNRDNPQKNRIVNLAIVNNDEKILARVEDIYKYFEIYASRYLHNNKNSKGFLLKVPCYVMTVRRRDDFEKILKLLEPYLVGRKRGLAQEVLEYLKNHPKIEKVFPQCRYCRKTVKGRQKQFCNLHCWHEFAKGNKNPNYRHGKYTTRND